MRDFVWETATKLARRCALGTPSLFALIEMSLPVSQFSVSGNTPIMPHPVQNRLNPDYIAVKAAALKGFIERVVSVALRIGALQGKLLIPA